MCDIIAEVVAYSIDRNAPVFAAGYLIPAESDRNHLLSAASRVIQD